MRLRGRLAMPNSSLRTQRPRPLARFFKRGEKLRWHLNPVDRRTASRSCLKRGEELHLPHLVAYARLALDPNPEHRRTPVLCRCLKRGEELRLPHLAAYARLALARFALAHRLEPPDAHLRAERGLPPPESGASPGW